MSLAARPEIRVSLGVTRGIPVKRRAAQGKGGGAGSAAVCVLPGGQAEVRANTARPIGEAALRAHTSMLIHP